MPDACAYVLCVHTRCRYASTSTYTDTQTLVPHDHMHNVFVRCECIHGSVRVCESSILLGAHRHETVYESERVLFFLGILESCL